MCAIMSGLLSKFAYSKLSMMLVLLSIQEDNVTKEAAP